MTQKCFFRHRIRKIKKKIKNQNQTRQIEKKEGTSTRGGLFVLDPTPIMTHLH